MCGIAGLYNYSALLGEREQAQSFLSSMLLTIKHRGPDADGVWVDADGGGVLHCAQQIGVVFQQLSSLASHGWQVEGYYRWKELP